MTTTESTGARAAGAPRPFFFRAAGGTRATAGERGAIAPGLTLLDDLLVVAAGGAGKEMVAGFVACAVRDGRRLHGLIIDQDDNPPAPRVLPDGRQVALFDYLPLTVIGNEDPLTELQAHSVLRPLYLGEPGQPGLLDGASAYSTLKGSGGRPERALLDLDLRLPQVEEAVRAALRQMRRLEPEQQQGGAGGWDNLGQERPRRERRRLRALIVGGGCGANGPAIHRRLPYAVRRWARDMGEETPLIYGVVAGPRLWDGFDVPAAANWRDTTAALAAATRVGLRWQLGSGELIDDRLPPYDRILLVDRVPVHRPASDEELTRFGNDTGRLLWSAFSSDFFPRLDALEAGQLDSPFMTLRGAVVDASRTEAAALAATLRAAGRLRQLTLTTT